MQGVRGGARYEIRVASHEYAVTSGQLVVSDSLS